MARRPATPGQIAKAKARRAELNAKLEAFLAKNAGEVFAFAKIKGGYYSEGNGARLAMQAEERGITITAVGAYDDWKLLGRHVRPKETALRVLAPAGSREVPVDSDDPEGPKRTRKFYRLAPTFAFEQTDPDEGQADLDLETVLERAAGVFEADEEAEVA
jgi:N-terminal domain of anti-restriction factor ArdC